MLRRSQTVQVTKTLHSGGVFHSTDILPEGQLPTKRNVIERVLHETNFWKISASRKVAAELVQKWVWCNVYSLHEFRVTNMVHSLMKQFKRLYEQPKESRKASFLAKEKSFMEQVDGLFDVFCEKQYRGRLSELEKKYGLRMTEEDHLFYLLFYQKGERKRKCLDKVEPLGPSDVKFGKRYGGLNTGDGTSGAEGHIDGGDSSPSPSTQSSVLSKCESPLSAYSISSADEQQMSQNRENWPNLAMMCERYQVSDRAGAAIAASALLDAGLVNESNKWIIDKNKLRREREKFRADIQKQEDENFKLVNGIYIDGKKDSTLVLKQHQNGKKYLTTELEEHIVIVGEPGEFYLAHTTPDNGKGRTIAQGIYNIIKDTELGEKLTVIGTDGTASMTGHTNGCIAALENLLGRSLQWAICLLHGNELPLRHIFLNLDGTATSPDSFSGPIGKKLSAESPSSWPVANFKKISNPAFPWMPNQVLQELSTDQYYAYRMCSAVIIGEVDDELRFLQIGPVVHSRWLTLASRILRFYTSCENPSPTLTTLAEFCVTVYFPSWFEIRYKNKLSDGPRNFFNMVKRVQNFPDAKIRKIACEVLQRNSYFAHPENLLMGMLCDEDEDTRRLAVNKIMAIRGNSESSANENSTGSVRKLLVPKINVKAKV